MSGRLRAWQHDHGFTLIEVMITIIIMGIVFAIASSIWFGAVESRKVDSGTNWLAADLRQAHSMATNRLADQTVTLTADQSEYTVPSGDTVDLDDNPNEDLVTVDTTVTIAFCPNGSAEIPPQTPVCSAAPFGPATTITVRGANNPAKNNHTIQINPATSEIKVVP